MKELRWSAARQQAGFTSTFTNRNLADITFRAIRVLKSVDLILTEDTRTSGKLLLHHELGKPTTPYFRYYEQKIVDHLMEQ